MPWIVLAGLGLLAACASRAPRPPATDSPKLAELVPRALPRGTVRHDVDYYPAPPKAGALTGRVLIEFQIDAHGNATGVHVLLAEADARLQESALRLVEHTHFDVKDPHFDPSVPTSYTVSVRICLAGKPCPDAFPGYEDNWVSLTGKPVRLP